MRQRQSSIWHLTILTTYLSHIHFSAASPISDLWSVLSNGTSILQERCESPCGYYGQVCCSSGETCYTDPTNNQASCSAGAPAVTAAATHCDTCTGSWVYWTSTITVIGSSQVCSTYSSYQSYVPATTYYAPAPVTTAAAVWCGSGQQSCGPICCASGQYCQWEGQCAPVAATSYASYTAPLRPTTIATVTATAASIPTTTVGFQPAVTTGAGVTIASESGGGGLSGGAIAGIVIGVILGIIILILLCICCCFGAAASSILGFFGIGRKKETRRTEVEEVYRRDGSRADGRTWYGTNARPQPKKKSSGVGGLGILAALAGFAAAIGLGKRNEKKRREEKSDYTSSYGTYSSYSSSDRRTRDTRRDDRRSRR